MVKGDQAGFTLVEVITALALLGVLVAVAVPIYSELTHMQQVRDQQFLALLALQEQMERIGRESVPTPSSGTEVKKSKGMSGTPFTYRISWQKKRESRHTIRGMVEVTWKDIKGKKHAKRLESFHYTP